MRNVRDSSFWFNGESHKQALGVLVLSQVLFIYQNEGHRMESWFTSIIVSVITAVITGGITLVGVQIQNSKQMAILGVEIDHIKQEIQKLKDEDIKRLEAKQDKHNSVIERTYKLEQEVAVIKARENL